MIRITRDATMHCDGPRSPLVTTWPVFTEASYLLAFSRQAQDGLLDMIQRGVVFIAPITDQDVPRVRVLMEKVQGCPHGFRRRYSRPHRGARIDLGHVHTR